MENIQYLYDNDNTLKIVINLKSGFFKSSGFLIVAILFIPIGLFMTLPILYLSLTFKIFYIGLSMKELLLTLLVVIFSDYIGTMTLYQWLKYNFGKEIIILNNKNNTLKCEKLLFNWRREKIYEYSNIIKIFTKVSSSRGPAYNEYYCVLKYKDKEFEIAQLNTFIEAQDLVKNMKEFMRNKYNKHKRK